MELLDAKTAAEYANKKTGNTAIDSFSILRWMRAGLKGQEGKIIRLKRYKVGLRHYTTATDLWGFWEALGETEGAVND